MNDLSNVIDIINSSLGRKVKDAILVIDNRILVDKSALLRCLIVLKHKLGFSQLLDLTAVDNSDLEYMDSNIHRFSLFYVLRNYKENSTLVIESRVTQNEKANSIMEVYSNADWYEREVYEMFGIAFKKHLNLRPLLRHDVFDVFPLKKHR